MKIAIGGFHIESCTFSPLLSQEKDFNLKRGNLLIDTYPFLSAYGEVEIVPLIYARALPGGPVERSFYLRFKDEFLRGLQGQGPCDGIFLQMHGAVSVDGLEDAEGDFFTSVRQVVGPDCLIAAGFDLHGNISRRVMDCVDILSAYRTAPHIDAYETLERVFAMLIDCLKRKDRPYKAFIPVPILLPGEQTSTEWEPAASLYRLIPNLIQDYSLMDASILIGYVWADEPRSSASVVTLGRNRDKVQRAAAALAQRFWDVRREFQFGVTTGSVDQCIQLALRSAEQPIVISDSGDNPTAGGVGDIPYILERMLALGVKHSVVAGIADPEAIDLCGTLGTGSDIETCLGGKLDPINGKPLSIKGKVRSLHSIPWVFNHTMTNRVAVVEVQGIEVILTEHRTPFHHLADFETLDIDPRTRKIVVVKIGYLEPELKTMAAMALLALSPGAVNQDITSLPFKKIVRPMYPFDGDMSWFPPVDGD